MVAGLEIASDADSEGEVVSADDVIPAGFDIIPKSLSCSLTCKGIIPPWEHARKIYYWDLTSGIRTCGELLKRRIYKSNLKPFLTNFKEKPNLISLSKMFDHEDETINKENAPPKVVPQITTVTNISTKFPYLKKREYDIWVMKMQNFISSSDILCWNIILKGNSAKSMTTDNDGNLKIRPPVTAEEHQQVQECYELSAEYDGKRDPKKLEKVQVAYRRRIKLKNGYFADEDNATTECDIKETLDKLVH
nr:phosphoenolpyruvate carboxylase [Tanacetum cinerariifolium]